MKTVQAYSSPNNFRLSPIKEIELAAAKRPGVISLAQGIPSFRTPQAIIDYVKQKIDAGACDKYSLTTGLSELREEISLSLEKDGLRYDPEREVLVTAGSIEGITASLLALTEPGDEVIIPSPTYASYLGAISLARCVPRYVELNEDRNFDFDVRAIERCITRRTKVLLYCSPNNPTGTLYSELATRELARLAERHNFTILTDEVYKDFYYTNDAHFTPALIPEARSRVIRVCSFSKAYAMTGWRVGFLHADARVTEHILKYHDAMVTCAPVVSQYAAIAALKFGQTELERFKSEYRTRRDSTLRALDRMSAWLDYQVPKATYFAFPRIKDTVPMARDSRALAYDILDRAGVALVPGIAFGPSGESHLRICYSREQSDIDQAMERLEGYFSGRRSNLQVDLAAKPVTTSIPLRRKILASYLSFMARLYIARSRPTVIGIAGTRGKTVFKRVLEETLSKIGPTQASILSYNTRIGLPLSVLKIETPKTARAKFLLPFRALGKVLGPVEQVRFLVLEYGAHSPVDAKDLLAVCKPDWLVISDLEAADPNLNHEEFLSAVELLKQGLAPDRVLIPGLKGDSQARAEQVSRSLGNLLL